MQSLRGFGYSPETALADLIDNSITAGAVTIDINFDWNDGDPRVTVLDDGSGMDEAALIQAMCFGGEGPSAVRGEGDLGRFGLGLKTASLSQCRCMTVITKCQGVTHALAWDIDEVISRRRWDAILPEPSISDQLEALHKHPRGTLVLWERMDAIGGLSRLDREAFFLRVREISVHLGMVFHRFIAGDARRISVTVNGRPVRAWDPFQRSHPATITMQTERVRYGGANLSITPYVLPHRDRFANDAEYEAAGGPRGWGERQGFYVYRGHRLLVPGGWLGLGGARSWTREESSRLARIAIDLPTGLDADWRIDVRKSQARPPGPLRPRLTIIAGLCRDKAREVFAWRGSRARGQTHRASPDEVWVAARNGSQRYRISRGHPAVRAIMEVLDDESVLLEGLLAIIERSVPVERIWLDVSEAEGASASSFATEEIPTIATQLAALIATLPADKPLVERIDQLIRHLPGDTSILRRAVLQRLEAAS